MWQSCSAVVIRCLYEWVTEESYECKRVSASVLGGHWGHWILLQINSQFHFLLVVCTGETVLSGQSL